VVSARRIVDTEGQPLIRLVNGVLDPVPWLSNIWVPPIRNRIDMLATGIKSLVGINVAGTDLQEIDRLATRIDECRQNGPGVTSALAERLSGGRYVDVDIDRMAARTVWAQHRGTPGIVSSAISGDNVGEIVDGLALFPITCATLATTATRSNNCAASPLCPTGGSRSPCPTWRAFRWCRVR